MNNFHIFCFLLFLIFSIREFWSLSASLGLLFKTTQWIIVNMNHLKCLHKKISIPVSTDVAQKVSFLFFSKWNEIAFVAVERIEHPRFGMNGKMYSNYVNKTKIIRTGFRFNSPKWLERRQILKKNWERKYTKLRNIHCGWTHKPIHLMMSLQSYSHQKMIQNKWTKGGWSKNKSQ